MEMEARVAQRFLNKAGLAEYLGKSVSFVNKHVSNGRMPGVLKMGGSVMFDKDVIDRRILGTELLLPLTYPEKSHPRKYGSL